MSAVAHDLLDAQVSSRSGFIASLRDIEWRAHGSGSGEYTFTGIAVLFDTWSEELWTPRGSFRERIRPGAFDDVLARKPDVKLLVNHSENHVLARTKSGTLELSADSEALRVWARVAPTSYATDLRMLMERGDVDQMSFGFDFDPDAGAKDRWWNDRTGEARRDVIKVSDLYDVTIAVFPAYVETTAAMRSLDRAVKAGIVVPRDIPTGERSERARQRYGRVLQVVSETPWAILPQSLAMIVQVIEAHAAGERVPEADVREAFRSSERDDGDEETGSVAVIPVHGPIFPRANLMTDMSGATDLQDVRAAFRAAVSDSGVSAIVLDIDSPGGVVSGVPEFAEEVRQAQELKPIVAVANANAHSAAYWIGSAAGEFVASPSSEVGSIGVYTAHTDWSRFEDMKGVKTTLISAGKYKVEGNPFEPLGEEARAAIQGDVNAFYEMFVAAVAKGRAVKPSQVRNGFGEGRSLVAKAALAEGMIDGIETFDAVVARLQRAPGRNGRSRRPVDVPSMPEEAFATRDALRRAFGLMDAPAGRDPAVRTAAARGAWAETDPAAGGGQDVAAGAETDPSGDGRAASLKARSRAENQSEKRLSLDAIGAGLRSPRGTKP